jgi:DNA-directed RNA polymerase specialized sigma24 family protein
MLYRYAGLNNREIGELMALDYSTVSVGRRRLRERCLKDTELRDLIRRIEEGCQR